MVIVVPCHCARRIILLFCSEQLKFLTVSLLLSSVSVLTVPLSIPGTLGGSSLSGPLQGNLLV